MSSMVGGAGTIYTNFTNQPNKITVDNNGVSRDLHTYTSPTYYDDTGTLNVRKNVPTTLLYAQADDYIDFVTFNQTTIHTLEIIDGAFVVLAAPGLEPGSLSDAKVASVTSVNRLEGDGTGRLRIVDGSTMIIHEQDIDYEHGQQVEVEVEDAGGGTGIIKLVRRSGKTVGDVFHLQVHLTIEKDGRLISPKSVVIGQSNMPIIHHWAGTWSGVENIIIDNLQSIFIAPTASSELGLIGNIQLDGSFVVSRKSTVTFDRCDRNERSWCGNIDASLTVEKEFVVNSKRSLDCWLEQVNLIQLVVWRSLPMPLLKRWCCRFF